MSTDLTLPGDIPGLLRHCSPVITSAGAVGTIVVTDGPGVPGEWAVANEHATWSCTPGDLALDLQVETGRTHAAWWLLAWLVRTEQDPPPALTAHERWKSRILVNMAVHRSCDLATLQRVCLRAAGRHDG